MTNAEFKAWFEGFTESMDEAPTEKQWKRIKARVKEIDGTPITYPVYIDRYRYWPYYYQSALGVGSATLSAGQTFATSNTVALDGSNNFDGVSAMYAAGVAERQESLNG